ncbi:hypothetical protein FRC12_002605 [Ceratobasidium sp. 428]|nr:hypothetical protein FRC09_017613 [Ceratobasidium sp. 395]KAG8796226.1 hypothetical protein FRC12_002605 [Ceratobasidium sp. 428]
MQSTTPQPYVSSSIHSNINLLPRNISDRLERTDMTIAELHTEIVHTRLAVEALRSEFVEGFTAQNHEIQTIKETQTEIRNLVKGIHQILYPKKEE